MNSTLNIYKNCLIIPSRNFKVDSISDYLSTLTKQTINDFQFTKHQLVLSIKVDTSQNGLDFTYDENFNYISIQNGTGKVVYYFIVRKHWTAQSTITFDLVCDTINSFYDSLNISPKTKVLREHRDRFFKVDNKWYRNIHFYSEGIVPLLYGEEKNELREEIDVNWYLVYMNQNNPSDSLVNPVDCFLMSDNAMNVSNASFQYQSGSITASTISSFLTSHQPSILFIVGVNNIGSKVFGRTIENHDFMKIEIVNNVITVHGIAGGMPLEVALTSSQSLTFENLQTIQYGSNTSSESVAKYYDDAGLLSSTLTYTAMGVSGLDKTDPRIIKIIKCPYSPITFGLRNLGSGYNSSSSRLIFDVGILERKRIGDLPALHIINLNFQFKRNIYFSSNYNPYKLLEPVSLSPAISDLRNDDNESKLYHSDFYAPKLVYDSFGFVFNLEKITRAFTGVLTSFPLEICCTRTINSRFIFRFNEYVCSPYITSDYNNIMPITRNNEEPIYNQQYINYLRAGYNYDVKSKQRTEFFTWLGTGLQMVGSIASFASSIYTGGFGVAMGITLATSSLGSLASSINTTMQAENTFNAKQDQLKLQTSKAYGSDDVDLLEFYSNNRAKFIEYKVSPKMKNLLSDLFFYTGYCCDLMKVPNTTSRTRFNFVSAELILVSTPNISDEMIKDIKDRFYLGITFLHKYNNEWDFSQLKENWEVAVIGS